MQFKGTSYINRGLWRTHIKKIMSVVKHQSQMVHYQLVFQVDLEVVLVLELAIKTPQISPTLSMEIQGKLGYFIANKT